MEVELQNSELVKDIRYNALIKELQKEITALINMINETFEKSREKCNNCDTVLSYLIRINTNLDKKRNQLCDKFNEENENESILANYFETFDNIPVETTYDSVEAPAQEGNASISDRTEKHKPKPKSKKSPEEIKVAKRVRKRKEERPRTPEKADGRKLRKSFYANRESKKAAVDQLEPVDTSEATILKDEEYDSDDECYYCQVRYNRPLCTKMKDDVKETECICKRRIACGKDTCGQVMKCKHRLGAHMFYIHKLNINWSKSKNFAQCDIEGCHHIAKNVRALQYHKDKVHSNFLFKCSERDCTFETTSYISYGLHARYKHREKKLVCSWPGCDFRCITNFKLKEHYTIHTGELPYECKYPNCDRKFRLATALSLHKRIDHEKRPMKRHKCVWPGCSYSTKARNILETHMLQHKDPNYRPFKCDWPGCTKDYFRMDHLKIHRKTHIGLKPHTCTWPNCGKSFMQKNRLELHYRIHTKDKRHQCEWPGCEYRAVLKGNVKKHYDQVHARKIIG